MVASLTAHSLFRPCMFVMPLRIYTDALMHTSHREQLTYQPQNVSKVCVTYPLHNSARIVSRPNIGSAQMWSALAFTQEAHLDYKKRLTRDEFWKIACTHSRAIQIGGAKQC